MQTDRFAEIESALGDRWTVRRIAGAFRPGVKNGRALESLFHSPSCACFLPNGDILVCTNTDRHIRVIRSDGIVESLPSSWLKPSGLCSTVHGTAVCDAGHHRIKFLSVDGKRVTSIAGVGRKGFKDGPVAIAEFNNPCSCCYDSAGALYVADKGNHSIRKIKDGLVLTVAGKGIPGHADGSLAMFNTPSDIAYHDPTGFLFVADTGNHCIRCIQPDLTGVTTVAGIPGNSGCHNGPCLDALFYFPSSIALLNIQHHRSNSNDHANGMTNIVIAVADTFNNQIRRIFFDKDFVDTLVGSVTPGTADGNRSVSKFHHPSWLRSKCSPETDHRSLIVCDTDNNIIREVFITEGSSFADSVPSTPKKTQDSDISRHPRKFKCSPLRSPLLPREHRESPHHENQKFDFSPRRPTHSKPKAAAVHCLNSQVIVSSIYSGVTHLFQYQQGAYRYMSPCRILLSPADSNGAKSFLEFLEIPTDRVLSSCYLDSDVQISVQNFTFVYFTKFGIGCRFGNKNETDKFLEVLRSLSISLCELEKPAQRFNSSTSAPLSPSNYAMQRLDRPFPLEVALVSPASVKAKHNQHSGMCQDIARDINDICADMMAVMSNEECQSGNVNHAHVNFWKTRLLDCSVQLSASTLPLEGFSQRSPLVFSGRTPSSQFITSKHSLRPMHSFGTSATEFQVSWFLMRGELEVSSTMHGQRSYFDVSCGEIVKMKIYFRGHNFHVRQMHARTSTLLTTFSHNSRFSDSTESFSFIGSQ